MDKHSKVYACSCVESEGVCGKKQKSDGLVVAGPSDG